jgi:hypothetical protein
LIFLTPRQRWDLALFLILLTALVGFFWQEARSPWEKHDDIDLLPLLRPEKHSVGPPWTRGADGVVSPPLPWSRVQIPYGPPEEYDLAMSVRRIQGLDSLNIGLVSGGRQFMVILDGESGSAAWIDRIDPGAPGSGSSRYPHKIFLEKDTPVSIDVRVRKAGLTVTANGLKILDWQGTSASLSLFPNWKVPDSRALFLGSFETSYRIERLTLSPRSGAGTPLP